ncbi:uncharacterized protein LOC120417955 isoform X2 [Culex pipiens pallens]|uniref:uncharacterized protein LOC120417955 isoform X2 n=1 Tax=Culex pipiens pallens TaxID=42434 RepID=UPI001954D8DA|nr:uncharacterized protein LOC120417955 isoform X2 [Culex pipiens pallens]XP_039436124.1 uncharacterized protein LOC120417955 isoform X2 [Culex pipiens pallens]
MSSCFASSELNQAAGREKRCRCRPVRNGCELEHADKVGWFVPPEDSLEGSVRRGHQDLAVHLRQICGEGDRVLAECEQNREKVVLDGSPDLQGFVEGDTRRGEFCRSVEDYPQLGCGTRGAKDGIVRHVVTTLARSGSWLSRFSNDRNRRRARLRLSSRLPTTGRNGKRTSYRPERCRRHNPRRPSPVCGDVCGIFHRNTWTYTSSSCGLCGGS